MKKMIQKPQYFFVGLALVVLFCGLFNKGQSIPINFEGVILDLDIWSTTLVSSFFFLMISVNYASLTLTKKTARIGLTIAHILLQIIALVPFLYFFFTSEIKRSIEEIMYMNLVIIVSFALFLLASLIHIINFLSSLLYKKE